ncbi:MAG: hypothetical protein K2X35_04540 [Bryobacteraceae bacterium]|nr:hypothetical protein [Bryobacteraceae bacterium]
MCDYSLHLNPNRLATEGEVLIATRFPGGSIGFASESERAAWDGGDRRPLTAVCIPPGARLKLDNIPFMLQWELCVSESEEVTFTQRGMDAWAYRDSIRFTNGKEILLQRLSIDQKATVLAMSSEHLHEDHHEHAEAIPVRQSVE